MNRDIAYPARAEIGTAMTMVTAVTRVEFKNQRKISVSLSTRRNAVNEASSGKNCGGHESRTLPGRSAVTSIQ